MLLATLLLYMDRLVLPQTATELKLRYAIGDARYGLIERGFAWAFAVGSVLFGFIADRFGPRRIYPLVLLGWSAAGLATPFLADPELTRWVADASDPVGSYNWLLICRIALGLFEAGHWPCALITARQILTAGDRPLGNGILQSGASIGAVLVPLYVMTIRKLGGTWQLAFWTVGAVGLLWVPLWLGLVRRSDLEAAAPGEREKRDADPSPAPMAWRPLMLMSLTLLAVIIGLTISWQFPRAWLPKYLKESQGFSDDATDWIVSAYYITADVGCLASGMLVRFLVKRGRTIDSARIIGFAVFAAIVLLATLVPVVGGGWLGVVLLSLAGAGILGLHPYYYALVQELPARNMGFLSGLLTAVGWFLSGEFQKQMGAVIEATKRYDVGFVVVGVAPLLGLLALVLFWRPVGASPSPEASSLPATVAREKVTSV